MGKTLACKDVGVDCAPEIQQKLLAAIKEDSGSSCCGGSCH